eukprot:gene13288-15619_t
MFSGQGDQEQQQIVEENPEKPTIFVSLAAYRDIHCSDTLNYVFNNAMHPERVFVGLVDQGSELLSEETPSHPSFPNSLCFRGLTVDPELIRTNLRRISMTIVEASGPTYARYKASTLYVNETYYMQIDSHLRFIKHWDNYVLWDFAEIPSPPPGKNGIPKAFFSSYPKVYENDTIGLPLDYQNDISKLCQARFNSNGIVTLFAQIMRKPKRPCEIPFMSAGFFFGSAQFVHEVPFDPHLPNLFEGEEIAFSVRLWADGYRFFAPTVNVCYHYYGRKGEPKFWDDNPKYSVELSDSQRRVKYILGQERDVNLSSPIYQNIERYDIKDKSIVDYYWKHYRIDIPNKKMDEYWCLKSEREEDAEKLSTTGDV